MPHDLRDPDGMFPYQYDNRYEQPSITNPVTTLDIDNYIQNVSFQACGRRLCPEFLTELKGILNDKGLMYQNPGDIPFQKAVTEYANNLKVARKVALNVSKR